MKNTFFCLIAVAITVSVGGCTSLRGLQQREETRERSETMLLRERIDRVAGQLGDIQSQIDQLWAETQKNQQASDRAASQVAERLNARIADLEKQINALEAARVADRKEIVEKMTKTVAELANKMGSARSTGRNVSEYGVEHTVKAGETLSEIAAAYDVKISALIEANQLKSPDQLRVGQKLFIPE